MLSDLYAILETEVRLAILTMGLDPGMGILHADLKSRDSFVYDVIEPLRPVVDGYLLTLREAGISQRSICTLLSGATIPRPSTRAKIVEVLNLWRPLQG